MCKPVMPGQDSCSSVETTQRNFSIWSSGASTALLLIPLCWRGRRLRSMRRDSSAYSGIHVICYILRMRKWRAPKTPNAIWTLSPISRLPADCTLPFTFADVDFTIDRAAFEGDLAVPRDPGTLAHFFRGERDASPLERHDSSKGNIYSALPCIAFARRKLPLSVETIAETEPDFCNQRKALEDGLSTTGLVSVSRISVQTAPERAHGRKSPTSPTYRVIRPTSPFKAKSSQRAPCSLLIR